MKTYTVECCSENEAVQVVKIKADSEIQALDITKRLISEGKLILKTKTPIFKVSQNTQK